MTQPAIVGEAIEPMSNDVIALIVSYNGGSDLVETIAALAPQVQKILVLDNGSTDENQSIISALIADFGISLVRFGCNMGIGFALNRGLEIAKNENFGWVLTMDQDSIAAPNMVSAMLASAKKVSGMKIICPSLAINGGNFFPRDDQFVAYAITSGNLVPMDVIAKIGGFNEEYFIDSVDFEFSLRVRSNQIQIVQSGRAGLFHRLGETTAVRFFSATYNYTRHSPLRRYYMVRNHLYLVSEFGAKNSFFLIKKTIVLMYQVAEILIFDSARFENCKMMWLGLCDFVRGKSGRLSSR